MKEKYYKQMYSPGHPRASSSGTVLEHILVAEKALGKYLPVTAEVHHINRNKHDNRPSNLVVCENVAYHRLLHVRQSVVDAGGNPDIHRQCSTCRRLLTFDAFNKRNSAKYVRLQTSCRECQSAYCKTYKRPNKVRGGVRAGEQRSARERKNGHRRDT